MAMRSMSKTSTPPAMEMFARWKKTKTGRRARLVRFAHDFPNRLFLIDDGDIV